MAATPTKITTLSVIIPAYNELQTIATVISRVHAVAVHGLRKEIILVDDGSTDGTRDVLEALGREGRVRVILQPANRGKGAAVRAGLEAVTGELVIIQDADVELSPEEYPRLVAPFLADPATQAVFGSRFLSGSRKGQPLAVLANRFLTSLTNVLHNASLTDMETCYKLCRTDVLKALDLKSERFDIEPEITSKLLRRGYAIHEVAISYQPRSRREGKSINWKDGVRAIMALLKWRFARKL
jgi:glycosyltransferase involved in cell wall biosynthesis